MSFLTGSIKLQIYNDQAQTEFPKVNLPDLEQDFAKSTVTAIQAVTIPLAALGDYTLNVTGSTSGMYVYSDSTDFTLSIDGNATPLELSAGVPGYLPVAVSTSVEVVNASATTATNITLILIQG